jgi:hypothetical protein
LLEEAVKPKSYVHWISEKDAVDCQVNLYDVLFNEYNPNTLENYLDGMNKDSLEVKRGAKMHKNLLSKFLKKTRRSTHVFSSKDSDFSSMTTTARIRR